MKKRMKADRERLQRVAEVRAGGSESTIAARAVEKKPQQLMMMMGQNALVVPSMAVPPGSVKVEEKMPQQPIIMERKTLEVAAAEAEKKELHRIKIVRSNELFQQANKDIEKLQYWKIVNTRYRFLLRKEFGGKDHRRYRKALNAIKREVSKILIKKQKKRQVLQDKMVHESSGTHDSEGDNSKYEQDHKGVWRRK